MSDRTETNTESPSLADAPAGAAPPGLNFDLEVGDADRYQMIMEVAHGGAGRILLARDRRLGRDVALKEQLRRDRGRDRFVREAIITAQLQHPAIVPVHDAALRPDGSPIYVMKLVTGRSLKEVIEEKTELRERLALLPSVIAVADAVAYAHSKGVIHRDLKPHNVLIGEFGETTLIDWGLAKRVDEESPAVEVVGTPAYMPPEQARGEPLDERADVYALGAMLYHLLGGTAPYSRDDDNSVLEQVKQGPPSNLGAASGVPLELTAIVGKAMSRERADRYATAKAFADDLKRFQAGRMVAAHAYSWSERLARFARRYRAALAVGAVALVVVTIVGAVSITRVIRERDRSNLQRAAAEDLVDFMLSDMYTRVSALGRLDLMEGVGGRVQEYYRAVARARESERASTLRRAKATIIAADVAYYRAQFSEAVTLATETRDTVLALGPPSADELALLSEAHGILAGAKWKTGSTTEANAEYQRAASYSGVAVALRPTRQNRLAEARALGNRADNEYNRQSYDVAINSYEAELESLARISSTDPDVAVELVRTTGSLIDALHWTGQYFLALPYGEACVAWTQTSSYPRRDLRGRKEEAECLNSRAELYVDLGVTGRAREGLAAALGLWRGLVDDEPADTDRRLQLVQILPRLADISLRMDDLGAAAQYAATAREEAGKLVATNPASRQWRRAAATAELVSSYVEERRSDYAAAVRFLMTYNGMMERLHAEAPDNQAFEMDLAQGMSELGSDLSALHDPTAVEVLQRALSLAESLAASGPKDWLRQALVGRIHGSLSDLAGERGDRVAQLDHARKYYDIAQSVQAATHAEQADYVAAGSRLADVLAGRPQTYAAARELAEAMKPELERLHDRHAIEQNNYDQALAHISHVMAASATHRSTGTDTSASRPAHP